MTTPGGLAVVGVLGAGTMGAGIAQVAAQAGHQVLLYDASEDAIGSAQERIRTALDRAAERGRISAGEAAAAVARLAPVASIASLAPAGVVIEAAPEALPLKQTVLSQAEAAVAADAILATNTSTLSVSAIASALARPERFCGMHFFNPAAAMPLVEVIRGADTAADVLETVLELANAWGKTPILVADTPGFIVNRVARPFYGEALRLVGDGVADVPTVDRLVRDAGFPMGPFELMDLIGIDVNLAAAQSVFDGFFGDPRFRPHPIQRAMVDSGRLGRKTGRGYYHYAESG